VTRRPESRASRRPASYVALVFPGRQASRLRPSRDDASAFRRRRPPDQLAADATVTADNRGWSLYGAPWLQPVAKGGKWSGRESGSDRRKPLLWVATGCRAKHGKGGRRFESVRGLRVSACLVAVSVVFADVGDGIWCPRSVPPASTVDIARVAGAGGAGNLACWDGPPPSRRYFARNSRAFSTNCSWNWKIPPWPASG
jgi:hypothetical protein